MERLLQDLRVAARGLWKDRSFAVTTVATLALCLAANVAIFAIVDSIGNIGGFAGPFAIGWVRDATGSFEGGLLALAGVLIAGAAIAVSLPAAPSTAG